MSVVNTARMHVGCLPMSSKTRIPPARPTSSRRLPSALSAPIAYCPDLEEAILPQTADVLKAIRDLAKY